MPKVKRPSPKHRTVADGITKGLSDHRAVLEAGYSTSTAHSNASKIVKSPWVRQALLERGSKVTPDELANLGKGGLAEIICQPDIKDSARVSAIRTALEVGGLIGAKDQMHMHLHHMAPETVERISRRMAELVVSKSGNKGTAQVIDAEVVESAAYETRPDGVIGTATGQDQAGKPTLGELALSMLSLEAPRTDPAGAGDVGASPHS